MGEAATLGLLEVLLGVVVAVEDDIVVFLQILLHHRLKKYIKLIIMKAKLQKQSLEKDTERK